MQEIITLDQFREIKKDGLGFVAITDKNLSKNCVHHSSCSSVSERYYTIKVLDNNKKYGEYYFTNDYHIPLKQFPKMAICKHCFD